MGNRDDEYDYLFKGKRTNNSFVKTGQPAMHVITLDINLEQIGLEFVCYCVHGTYNY
jgi:hypothetical protein